MSECFGLKRVDLVGMGLLYAVPSFLFLASPFTQKSIPVAVASGAVTAGHSAECSALKSPWNLHSSLWQLLVL